MYENVHEVKLLKFIIVWWKLCKFEAYRILTTHSFKRLLSNNKQCEKRVENIWSHGDIKYLYLSILKNLFIHFTFVIYTRRLRLPTTKKNVLSTVLLTIDNFAKTGSLRFSVRLSDVQNFSYRDLILKPHLRRHSHKRCMRHYSLILTLWF